MAKRPKQIPQRDVSPARLRALAKTATYVGSREHKTHRWWGGLPGLRLGKDGSPLPRPRKQNTTICPLTAAPQEQRSATSWIKAAIRSGRLKYVEGDKDFPKHVWYRVNGQAWFGFCINSILGLYKGWPLENEDPDALFD